MSSDFSTSSEIPSVRWSDFTRAASLDSATTEGCARITGKRVLITGAGGSIGSALSFAVYASGPAGVTLMDTSEAGLYQTDRRLREMGSLHHVPVLGSVTDNASLAYHFELHRPQIIFHAAGLKHVPLMEQNPFAAIANNALGTLRVAEEAINHSVEHLVVISTDKAVQPSSMMGASKRIAELIVLTQRCSITRMTALRLCNVIGSQGSVLPLFLDQIDRGRSLTVTHPEARRYFITMNQALRAILEALENGSTPCLLIPNIDSPIRILDLAHHLLQAHGRSSDLTFTGLRPGDKLSEKLLARDEKFDDMSTLNHHFLRAVRTPVPELSMLRPVLSLLRDAVKEHNLADLLRGVLTLVPDYEPSSVIRGALSNRSSRSVLKEVGA